LNASSCCAVNGVGLFCSISVVGTIFCELAYYSKEWLGLAGSNGSSFYAVTVVVLLLHGITCERIEWPVITHFTDPFALL
jgi:hypothetical protein